MSSHKDCLEKGHGVENLVATQIETKEHSKSKKPLNPSNLSSITHTEPHSILIPIDSLLPSFRPLISTQNTHLSSSMSFPSPIPPLANLNLRVRSKVLMSCKRESN